MQVHQHEKKADGSVGGFGFHVEVQHKIDGKFYTSAYAHMKGRLNQSQGAVSRSRHSTRCHGKLLATQTGKHLPLGNPWWVGRAHGRSADGKGFVNPIKFAQALIAKEDAIAEAPKATP